LDPKKAKRLRFLTLKQMKIEQLETKNEKNKNKKNVKEKECVVSVNECTSSNSPLLATPVGRACSPRISLRA
jgi:hypothetical protein